MSKQSSGLPEQHLSFKQSTLTESLLNMGVTHYQLSILLLALPLVLANNVRSINFDDLKSPVNENRPSVDFVPEHLEKDFRPDDDETLQCGNEPVNVFDGSQFFIRSENFPRAAPLDTSCTFKVRAQPGVAVDLMCSLVDLPCRLRNFLDITSPASEKRASFCTRSGAQKRVRISLGIRREATHFVFSHRIDGRKAGQGFSCLIRGLGGAQRQDGPETRVDLNARPNNNTRIQSRSVPNCGLSRYGRIIGGWVAAQQEYPWMVSLDLGGGLCGGSLINSWWILTAAHCTIGRPTSGFRAHLGCHTRHCNINPKRINANVIPTNYNWPLHDVALIRMTVPQTAFSNSIRPVCLANTYLPVGTGLYASGWGLTSSGGSVSPVLKDAYIAIVPDSSNPYGLAQNAPHTFYTRTVHGNICMGDSGSPVVWRKHSGNLIRWIQYGIVTIAPAGCPLNFPSGHAEIPFYFGWITGVAGPVGTF